MSNPFDDDADDDILKRPGVKSYTTTTTSSTRVTSYTAPKRATEPEQNGGDDFNFYERQIEEAMQSSLASAQRSLKALEESETVGIGTAEDLLVQREKLQNVDRKLDEINSTAISTQRHLNNIKSVFGGVKNYFSKKPPEPGKASASASASASAPSKLGTTVENIKVDTSGFYASDAASRAPTLAPESKAALQGTRWGAMDDEIDESLDAMSRKLKSLQSLGTALGQEIDDQNELLDRLGTKTNKTDSTVRNQDQQMKKILGYDKKKMVTPESIAAEEKNKKK